MISFIMILVMAVSVAPVSKQNVEAKKSKSKKKELKVISISSTKPIVLKQTIPPTAAQKAKKPSAKGKTIKIKDLFDIRAKEYTKDGKYFDDTNNPYNYKTVKAMKFKTLQGSCIYGDCMYVAFTDKGRKNKHEAERDLTILAAIDLKKKVVKGVEKFYGLDTLNLYGLGHSNDLESSKDLIKSAWYLHHNKKGKEKYDNRIGFLNKSKKYSYGGNNIVDTGLKGRKFIFGISEFKDKKNNKRTALGTVLKRGNTKKMYLMSYDFKDTGYEVGKKEFEIEKKCKIKDIKYNVPQCLDYVNKKIYIVKFNRVKKLTKKEKKNPKLVKKYKKQVKENEKAHNNVVEVYSKKKRSKVILIEDPKIKKKSYKKYHWEVECFKYYKGTSSFYYTQYQPEKKKTFLFKCKKSKFK